ncbi:MAG: acyl-ACP--UDP-N-acetylglucosamine O-acyltransferase [Candidatus Dadabacteria bacterium]|nr:MAG: acyl-ACP--UDP-N-acetylglucosamine O-acyltransferase [Candidatus Dadabacteria bacterium]
MHPTAIVAEGARIGRGTRIGPYAVIGEGVSIGEDCWIGAHVVIEGETSLGARNRVFPFASLGTDPQDLKYRGEATRLEIGDRNTIREFATMNRGTAGGGGVTRVGDDNLFMAYSHVAHDCRVGNHVVLANAATLAGHVTVEDYAIVGGLVAIHQHARVGESALLGGGAMVSLDVPPFCIAAGDRARLHGLNVIGLQRRGFDKQTISDLRGAYRVLFQSSLKLRDALAELRSRYPNSPRVEQMARFIESSQRGICR